MRRPGVLMRGDAEQAPVEADVERAGVGVGQGEGEFVGIVHLAQVHGGGGGEGGEGGIGAEDGIEIGEGAVGLGHHALHFGAHAVGGMLEARGLGGALKDGEAGEQGKR